MADLSEVQEHMEVVDSEGGHVGTVDEVEGNRIKLTKSDSNADGEHHYISADDVESVDGDQVRLSADADLPE